MQTKQTDDEDNEAKIGKPDSLQWIPPLQDQINHADCRTFSHRKNLQDETTKYMEKGD